MVHNGMLAGMRPTGTAQQLEKRRRLAIELLKSGKHPAAVARAVSASRSSVQRWQEAYARSGAAGLKARPIPGRLAHLLPRQLAKLKRVLLRGPLAAGYLTELWTLERIGQVIRKHFGVRYHPGHVWRILRRLGWSSQKPERRPMQRDEEAVQHWLKYHWPRIKKSGAPRRTPGFH